MFPRLMEFKEPVPMCPNCGNSKTREVERIIYDRDADGEVVGQYVHGTHKVCATCHPDPRQRRTWTPGREP